MKVNDLGKRGSGYTSPTPPYGVLSSEKKNEQQGYKFNSSQPQRKDSQDLMGGPQYRDISKLSPSERGMYATKKLEEVAMRSWGRYHNQ